MILVLRARTARCELIDTPGTWLGIIEDISHATVDTAMQLHPGDVTIWYSDGITEAMNERQEQFGIQRLCQAVEQCEKRSVREIHAHILRAVRAWSQKLDDDMTLLVFQYEGAHGNEPETL